MTDPWRKKMSRFVADQITRTARLSAEEYGALTRLEEDYWANGRPPDGDIVLARIVGMSLGAWRRIRERVLVFFRREDGRLVNDRLDADLAVAEEKWMAQVAASTKGVKARKQTVSQPVNRTVNRPDNQTVNRTVNQTLTLPSPSPSPKTTTTNYGTALSAGADGEPPAAVETLPAIRSPDLMGDAALWNAAAARCGWPQCRKLGKSRGLKLLARKRDPDWNLPAILTAAEQSAGLRGAQWFGLDWLIANDGNYLKVLEGKYRKAFDERPARVDPVEAGNRQVIEQWERERHGERNGGEGTALGTGGMVAEDRPAGPEDLEPVSSGPQRTVRR